jgi:hypothetical protein
MVQKRLKSLILGVFCLKPHQNTRVKQNGKSDSLPLKKKPEFIGAKQLNALFYLDGLNSFFIFQVFCCSKYHG